MPTVLSREEVQALAHCPKPLCEGYDQQPVAGVREEIGWTYAENGGDAPFTEKSSVTVRFADPAEEACPECGRPREITTQERQEYMNQSNMDPTALLAIKYAAQAGHDVAAKARKGKAAS